MSQASLPHILLIDDEPSVCSALSRALLHTSPQHPVAMAASVTVAHSTRSAMELILSAEAEPNRQQSRQRDRQQGPEAALARLDGRTLDGPRHYPYDLLMVDMCLGQESGLDLLRMLKQRSCGSGPDGASLPDGENAQAQAESFEGIGLMLLTGRATAEQMAQAVRLGVDDLLLKPVTLRTLREAVARCHARLLQRRSQIGQLREFADELLSLRERSNLAARSYAALQSAVLEALLGALSVREPGSMEHSVRVQTYTSFFARMLNYPESLRPQLEHAALLHDIGKIGLSDQLLFRPDALAPAELERMHPHSLLGEQILGRIGFLRPAALIVRHHHEHYNGRGYPDGLAGEDIPLGSRIFAMMDALDALTTDRPYRPASAYREARAEILRCAGEQFDPHLCECFGRIPAETWQQIRIQVAQRLRALDPIGGSGAQAGAHSGFSSAKLPSGTRG